MTEPASPPLTGRTLYLGPSNVGKTRRTAAALDAWADEHGPLGAVVLDFAPELERDGDVLGGHISRFTDIPDDTWTGVLDARAPRAEGRGESETRNLARWNAEHAGSLIDDAPPDPDAVFVNDVTIPFQHESGDLDAFLDYCEDAECVIMNALESDVLGTTDTISTREAAVRKRLRTWADSVVELE